MTGAPIEPFHEVSADPSPLEEQPAESIWLKLVQGIRSIAEAILFGVLLFFVIRFAVQTYQVEGGSMLPTLETGERVFVNKLNYLRWDRVPLVKRKEESSYIFSRPARGDIVVFTIRRGELEQTLVKRVIGLPGEEITIHDGRVFINNQPLYEPYLTELTSCVGNCHLVVPADAYFLMGDNRGGSLDSRSFGPVPAHNIIGKVWAVYWPLEHLALVNHDRPVVAATAR